MNLRKDHYRDRTRALPRERRVARSTTAPHAHAQRSDKAKDASTPQHGRGPSGRAARAPGPAGGADSPCSGPPSRAHHATRQGEVPPNGLTAGFSSVGAPARVRPPRAAFPPGVSARPGKAHDVKLWPSASRPRERLSSHTRTHTHFRTLFIRTGAPRASSASRGVARARPPPSARGPRCRPASKEGKTRARRAPGGLLARAPTHHS